MKYSPFSITLFYLLFSTYNKWAVLIIFLLNLQSIKIKLNKYDTNMVHLNCSRRVKLYMTLFYLLVVTHIIYIQNRICLVAPLS